MGLGRHRLVYRADDKIAGVLQDQKHPEPPQAPPQTQKIRQIKKERGFLALFYFLALCLSRTAFKAKQDAAPLGVIAAQPAGGHQLNAALGERARISFAR
jgi:hypothetical protein